MTLTEFRRHKKISQVVMGRRIGMSGRAVSSYETGFRKMTLEIAHKMAVELGITMDELYDLFHGAGEA
ncbi:MAG: helix-turn-helix transcriptional regulator [Clostridia bacterium]|nr:helix-turn-helix transcriptional regulator [Clostridia bacterium]